MILKSFQMDVIGVWLLLSASFALSFFVNQMRLSSLPINYSSQQVRLSQSVKHFKTVSSFHSGPSEDVSSAEMQAIVVHHSALVLDARPQIFYSISHIPTALSLPREDFERQYAALQTILASRRDGPIVVYCSESDCQDSQMVADALRGLGYPKVRVFRQGWAQWQELYSSSGADSE